MRNGVNIHDLNGVEAATSQLPLIGFTVLWRLEGIRVSHLDLEQALQASGFEKYLPDSPAPRVALRRALSEWIKTKQQTARTLQLQICDEDQDENGGGRRRTLVCLRRNGVGTGFIGANSIHSAEGSQLFNSYEESALSICRPVSGVAFGCASA
jgi:hypothetical protein